MTSVLLVVRPESAEASALAGKARAWWEERGATVSVFEGPGGELPPIDLAMSLGGDGTMLRTVQLALEGNVPVLGVNLGRMGYLAEVEPSGLETALEAIAEGRYVVEERMAIEVVVERASAPPVTLVALNEVIVEKTAPGHTIRVAVSLGGRPFLSYVADGLLACTPTGSTAYNLSAHGPVVSPRLAAVVLTPVAPHLAFDRSLVLDPTEEIEFRLLDGHPAAAVADGSRVVPLEPGDAVRCRGAESPVRFISFGELDFHAVLRSRFSIKDR